MRIFIFSLLFLCTGMTASACKIELTPPHVIVRFGGSVSANCSTSSCSELEGMGWESPLGGQGLTRGVSSLPFHIAKVDVWDVYSQCFITMKNSEQKLENLDVTVYKMPEIVSMPQPVDEMVEGEWYPIHCDIIDVAPVKYLFVLFHKGNEIISNQTFDGVSKTPVNRSSDYKLKVHRNDDGNEIWCEAQLNLWPAEQPSLTMRSRSHGINVLYPPTFTEPENETLEVPANEKITLNCTATGNPVPTYRWRFSHSSQEMINIQNVEKPVLMPSFQIKGTYSCTASNKQGSTTKYFTVIEVKGNRTTFAVLLAMGLFLGVLVIGTGLFLVKSDGKFSCNRGNYQPTSSGPIFPAELPGLFKLEFSVSRRFWEENIMGNNFLTWILIFCMFCSVSGEGCSLILKPSRVVVGFGEPVSVSCEAARPVRVLGWESAISATHTQEDRSVQWKVDSLIDWIEEPICYGVFYTAPRQCEEKLNLVLYKTPDSVSIKQVNHTGPMVEGKEYQLLCEVQNVAPVQYLTLRWYRGQTEVYKHSFSDLTSSSPVQVSSTLVITPTKAENGAVYRCVAELELGPEGPQPPPTVSSEQLTSSVYFPPTFLSPDMEILDLTLDVEITLNCTATGNPAPVYSWESSQPLQEKMEGEAIVTTSSLLPGTYTCTASNTLEKKSKQFIVKAKTKGI
ncbi:vascular cell adhesion protein 1-like [Leuresthes tenuis]|uniref:vascular cell adhesion protein 1-like n=1 Tax=Leuresthes tenuis TaxID=355514 RepID=UPI003B507DF2